MIGVVADDFTGANDIGIMFALNNYRTYVYSVYDDPSRLDTNVDVLILNTNSRLDPPEVAYGKVRQAVEVLKSVGCDLFHKKTCSVFRGNIGPEFDAMLDTLGVEFCPVILGFPRNGRTTRQGIHYVHGQLLEESPFRNDPTHPMTESNLVSILQKQTSRRVGVIPFDVVTRGVDAVRQALAEARKRYQYVILDVLSQDDLYTIAGAVKDERALAGSSAIAEELPKWLGSSGKGYQLSVEDAGDPHIGTLAFAGSVTPQTRKQVDAAKRAGYFAFTVEVEPLFDAGKRTAVVESLASAAAELLSRGANVLIHSQNEPDKVAEAKKDGARLGLNEREVGRLVSGVLSDIARNVIESCRLSRLIILGGETSGAVSEALGIVGNVVLEEIDPGVPSGLSLGDTRLLIVPKSGSFGAEDFIVRADQHLRDLQRRAADQRG